MKQSNAWVVIVALVCFTVMVTTLGYHHDSELTARICIGKVAVGQGVTQCEK